MGDLLVRLDNENHEIWRDLFDAHTKKMRSPILTFLNGKGLSPSVLAHTPLSENDQITFLLSYGGG